MRSKKWLTIITLVASCIALIVAIISHTESGKLTYDIALAVFGSALLGFIMSLTEYFAARRAAMERFYAAGCRALSEFRKIKYVDLDAPKQYILDCFAEEQSNAWSILNNNETTHNAKDILLSWYEAKGLIPYSEEAYIDPDRELDKLYQYKMQQYRETYLKCARSYVKAAGIRLGELGNAYGELEFLFGNKSVRNDAYNEIYDKMCTYRELLDDNSLLQFFSNGKAGNIWVLVRCVDSICSTLFDAKNIVQTDGYRFLVYQTKFDEIDNALEGFRAKIYPGQKPKYPKPIPIFGQISEPIYFEEE